MFEKTCVGFQAPLDPTLLLYLNTEKKMPIIGLTKRGITIQVRDPNTNNSQSITIHNMTGQEAYNKILFLFTSLAENSDTTIKFYNKTNEEKQT